MDKKTLFGIGAAALLVGYAGYKYFNKDSDDAPATEAQAIPTTNLDLQAVALESELAVTELVVVEEIVNTESTVVIEDAIEMAVVEVAPTVTTGHSIKSEAYRDAERRFMEASEESARTGDQQALLKGTFDLYVAALSDPATLDTVGDSVRAQLRKNQTTLTFANPNPDSPIATYRIESDQHAIRGVEVRLRDGRRRYDRSEDDIIDALFALSGVFQARARDVVPTIEVTTPETAVS